MFSGIQVKVFKQRTTGKICVWDKQKDNFSLYKKCVGILNISI